MSVHVMVAIFDADGLASTEKLVALAYAEHGHDDGSEARAGIERICQYTALSRRTVQTALQSLLAKKVLYVDRPATNKKPTCYKFFLTPDGKNLTMSSSATTAPQEDSGGATDTARGATDDGLGRDSCTQTVKEPSDEPLSSLSKKINELCILLADLIEANGSKRPDVNERWETDMRLLHKKDDRSFSQIENMIHWCQADDFWRANILSPAKLRSKYDQMRLKALANGSKLKSRDQLKTEIDEATNFVLEMFLLVRDQITRPASNELVEKVLQNVTLTELSRMQVSEVNAMLTAAAYDR